MARAVELYGDPINDAGGVALFAADRAKGIGYRIGHDGQMVTSVILCRCLPVEPVVRLTPETPLTFGGAGGLFIGASEEVVKKAGLTLQDNGRSPPGDRCRRYSGRGPIVTVRDGIVIGLTGGYAERGVDSRQRQATYEQVIASYGVPYGHAQWIETGSKVIFGPENGDRFIAFAYFGGSGGGPPRFPGSTIEGIYAGTRAFVEDVHDCGVYR